MRQLFLSQYILMKLGELITDISTLVSSTSCNLHVKVGCESSLSQDLLLIDIMVLIIRILCSV